MSQPDADGCELDEGERVGRVFLVSGGDRAKMLKLVEEALDQVPVAIQEGAERGRIQSWSIGRMFAQAPWARGCSFSANAASAPSSARSACRPRSIRTRCRSFENGVLSVILPKTQPQERSRRIQVQGAPQQASIEQETSPGSSAGSTSSTSDTSS